MPRLSLGGNQGETDDTATLETRFNLLKGTAGTERLSSHRWVSVFAQAQSIPCLPDIPNLSSLLCGQNAWEH